MALGVSPLPAAPADDGTSTVEGVEQTAREAAARHLDAVSRLASTSAEREALERSIADTQSRLDRLELVARGRSAEAYKRAGANLTVSFDVADAGELSRSQALLSRVTEDDRRTFDELTSVREELESQHNELAERREQEEAEAAELEATADELNSRLAAARAEAAAQAQAAAAAAEQQADEAEEPEPADSAPSTTEAPAARRGPAPPPPAPNYGGTPGSHPQHNHPFLVCTRAHESSGNYSVVSASGLYYGAYQFLKSTWNAAAVNFGRSELVGVPPNQATPYDQDDLAWRVYQAQGNGPWGGRC